MLDFARADKARREKEDRDILAALDEITEALAGNHNRPVLSARDQAENDAVLAEIDELMLEDEPADVSSTKLVKSGTVAGSVVRTSAAVKT